MGDFVLVSLHPAAAQPAWLAALEPPPAGWSLEKLNAHLWLFVSSSNAPALRRVGLHDLLIGDVHHNDAAAFDLVEGLGRLPGPAAGRALLDKVWGSYVHVRRDAGSGEISLLRSPCGALDALVWPRGQAWLAASALPAWLTLALPQQTGLDWDLIAAFAADPTLQTASLALTGVHGLAPGEYWSPAGSSQLWSPGALVRAARRQAPDPPEALRACVDRAVVALGVGKVLIEVSGGLDSAIVSTSLAAGGGAIACALNYHVRDRQGDERAYAAEVALRLEIPLIQAEKVEQPLDLAALAELSNGPRPALNSFDHHHDADVARRCRETGIEVILTGQGGDNVFFQSATPLIAADALPWDLSLRAAAGLARWQERSVYGLLGAALRAWLGGQAKPARPRGVLTTDAWQACASAPIHPWLRDLAGVPPAKRLQIAGLANAQIVHGACRRGQVARLRHPLLSKPVVEHCLKIPAIELTSGGRDRGLARDAFATRLPPSVSGRRTKGRMSAYYGRVLALSLSDLRPLLLEGRLAGEGVIDRDRLDDMLTIEHLIWRGGYGTLVNLTMLELWVRAWEGRLPRRG